MKITNATLLTVFLYAIQGLAWAEPAQTQTDVLNNDGDVIGQLALAQGTKGVVINLKVKGLPPGRHGMHFHAVGDCSDLKAFKSAGGHVDPDKKPHGFLNPDGPHEGNLPNLVVAEGGAVEVELYSTMVSLDSGKANLLDADGSALIVHAEPDDHNTQPIGGSGGRLACAVIKSGNSA